MNPELLNGCADREFDHPHHHSLAAINWIKGPNTMYFGMNVGCGVDQRHPALSYSRPHLKKAILSCGIVIDGNQPYLEIM